ncbi:MAG: histidine phosphatase family protein [Chloroflexi bacterium]|nr:histidine phosphatase family protein [Chloroflexota bacterium]
MLELLLVRHADAGDPLAWTGPDADRPLSRKGQRQAERLAALLAGLRAAPDALISSPKARAARTAELLGAALRLDVRVHDGLAGPLDLEALTAILADNGAPHRPILVGHDPDFSDLASELVGSAITLRKGALARIDLELPPAAGEGVLRWLVPPEVVAR